MVYAGGMSTFLEPTPAQKARKWNRLSWAIVIIFMLVASLLIGQGFAAQRADAYPGNKVYNQTGAGVSMQWDNGTWVSVQDYTFSVRQVRIPAGQCYRFIGPGVNAGYRAYLSPLYKTVGAGTWWVQRC